MTSSQVRPESFAKRVGRVVFETGYAGLVTRATARLLFVAASALEASGRAIICSVPPRLLTGSADRRRLQRNVEMAGRHRGQRCVILGNGPSLTRTDLGFLRDEICFTVNQGHRLAERAGLRPRYHAVVDAVHLQPEYAHLFEEWRAFAANTGATLLLSTELADRFAALGHDVDHYAVKQYLISTYFDESDRLVPIDLSLVQPGYLSVVHFAIVAALYMGFSDIRLLGCDMDFFVEPHSPLRHSYDEHDGAGTPTASELFGWDQVDLMAWALLEYRGFRQLGKLATRLGARIVNASEHGILNVFPREPLPGSVKAEPVAEDRQGCRS
jgi:hypothetical protein